MMDCDFLSGNRGDSCLRCGYTLKQEFHSPPARNCSGPPGLGDRVAFAIKMVTRALRVSRWLCETATCGCAKRRRKLNRFGRWLLELKALPPAQPGE